MFEKLIFYVIILQQISPNTILEQIRKNTSYRTSKFYAELEIKKGKRNLIKLFKGFSKVNEFYIEFVNPEDKGIKYLKIKENLYLYLPEIDDIVRFSGDMLKQSFMGSDLSYEDIMQEDPLKFYKPLKIIDTLINTKKLYSLEIIDTTGKAPYYCIKLLVDKENYIWIKEELFTKTGRKIKEVEAIEFKKINDRYFPISIIMRDLRIKDSYTKFTLLEIELDVPVPDYIFRLDYLKK